jgi:hypothetical protein
MRLTKRMRSRRRTFTLPSLLAAASSAAMVAQTHHVAPPVKVTRAIAVFEWTGDLSKPTATRLVPVSLFINGHMEDAGLYMARPVPFALQPGDIYSVEVAGDEKGTFDIEHARDFTSGRLLADVDPVGAWYGFGRFAALAPPKPVALHPTAHPSVVNSSSDSGRPHLNTKSTGGASSSPEPGSTSGDSTARTPMGDDPDRPTLGRRTSGSDNGAGTQASSSSQDSSATAGSTDSASTKDTDPERPSLRKRSPENTGKKSPPQSGVTGPEHSLNDDPDRPIIRHGKTPAQEEASELKGTPSDMHQVAAVSDPANREPHRFARSWDSAAERADVLSHLQELARAQAATYLTQNRLTPGAPVVPAQASPSRGETPSEKGAPTLRRTPGGVNTSTSGATVPAVPSSAAPPSATPAKSAASKIAARRTAGKDHPAKPAAPPPAPLSFANEQLTGYTLTYGGLPTFVYTAQVPVTTGGPVYITLVAQKLPSGEFQIALRNITDAMHLDRTPWFRPIDAVDPDWSHRASLLFELRAGSSRQFALYRLVSAQAEQQFVSEPIQ